MCNKCCFVCRCVHAEAAYVAFEDDLSNELQLNLDVEVQFMGTSQVICCPGVCLCASN